MSIKQPRHSGYLAAYTLFALALSAGIVRAGENVVLQENFEAAKPGTAIEELGNWQAFRGFRGATPQAVVEKGAGVDGSQALAVRASETFRADNWGVRRMLKPVEGGIVWLRCRFHPPAEWKGGVYFDARRDRTVIARIGGARYQRAEDAEPVLRFHASHSFSYWRMYSKVPLQRHWYTLRMRVDLDGGTYAAWVDDQVLGEELPLCGTGPIEYLHLGLGGSESSPARIDNLYVGRTPPEKDPTRTLLPEPSSGLLFRFAVVGDPQIGFSDYKADKRKFAQAVEQINRSGADMTIIVGDMVHDKDDEQAYRDLRDLAGELNNPVHYVRGNHESEKLYRKHFVQQLNYSVRLKGMRFIFIDAVGNQVGLSDEQLAWIEEEFQAGERSGEEMAIVLHVSPWQDNDKGRGTYNQIGSGREKLLHLLKKHKVRLSLSGHYHRGLWQAQIDKTDYFVLGGTALVKHGWLGWCLFDVYPDRIAMHQKPLFFAYERANAEKFYNHAYRTWSEYDQLQQSYPYLQRGPRELQRHYPAK